VLRRLRTPALILKGSYDYLLWSTALDCRAAVPSAAGQLREAGHLAYGDPTSQLSDDRPSEH
jgi:hypothetical protein